MCSLRREPGDRSTEGTLAFPPNSAQVRGILINLVILREIDNYNPQRGRRVSSPPDVAQLKSDRTMEGRSSELLTSDQPSQPANQLTSTEVMYNRGS